MTTNPTPPAPDKAADSAPLKWPQVVGRFDRTPAEITEAQVVAWLQARKADVLARIPHLTEVVVEAKAGNYQSATITAYEYGVFRMGYGDTFAKSLENIAESIKPLAEIAATKRAEAAKLLAEAAQLEGKP